MLEGAQLNTSWNMEIKSVFSTTEVKTLWSNDEYGVCVADVRLSSYSKLLLASQDQVLGLLEEERAALKAQLKQEQDDPQACFIQSALLQLQVIHACVHTFITFRYLFNSGSIISLRPHSAPTDKVLGFFLPPCWSNKHFAQTRV